MQTEGVRAPARAPAVEGTAPAGRPPRPVLEIAPDGPAAHGSARRPGHGVDRPALEREGSLGPTADRRRVESAAAGLERIADLSTMIMALETRLRDLDTESRTRDVEDAQTRAEAADIRRERAQRRAHRAEHRGRVLRRFLRVFTRLVQGLSIALGATGTPLAAAGAALAALAPLLTRGLREAGVVREDRAQWVELAIGLAGGGLAALQTAGGSTSTAVVSARIRDVIDRLGPLVESIGLAGEAAGRTGSAFCARTAGLQGARAEQQRMISEDETERMDEAVEELRSGLARFARVAGRLRETADLQHETRMAIVRSHA
jgi:hypothetical protein